MMAGAPPSYQPGVYVGAVGGNLYAFSPDNGAVRWCNHIYVAATFTCPGRCPPSPFAIISKPLAVNGVVYVCVSGYGGYTYAFNASDGSLRWVRETNCAVASIPFADYAVPIFVKGVLYTGSYALNAGDGKILWRSRFDVPFGSVDNGSIYAYSENSVYALNVVDGSLRWKYDLNAPIGDLPTAANGMVYFGDIDGDSDPYTPGKLDTYALSASNGALRWRYATGVIASSSAVVINGVVYIGSFESALYALDAATGKLRWRYHTGTSVEATPEIVNGVIYITSDGAYALNANDGSMLWHNALGANQATSFTSAIVMNGIVYLGKTNGSGSSSLYALDISNGRELWHYKGLNQLSPPSVG